MFYLVIAENRYLIIAALGGGVLAVLFTLGYLAMWMPRLKKGDDFFGFEKTWRATLWSIPWIVSLVVFGVYFFTILFVAYYWIHPPNW